MTGVVVRAALSAVKYPRQHHVNLCGSIFAANGPKAAFAVSARPCLGLSLFPTARNFSSQQVTKNLHLMTPEDVKPKIDKKSLAVEVISDRPLVVFLEWMAAHKNHVKKFTDLYLGSGYDVLVAPLKPSQLLFPTSGSQVLAAEVAQFLAINNHYSRIVVHGFSIGAYVWGEVQTVLSRDTSRYSSVIQRIHGQIWDSVVGMESMLVADDLIRFLAENPAYKRVIVHGFSVGGYLWGEVCLRVNKHPALPQQIVGQVWDSLVDVVGVSQGVAASIFPKNDALKKMVNSCIQLHLWMFRNIATKHYEASSDMFHDPPVKAPALILASRSDQICSFREMMGVVDGWRDQGVPISMKIWDDSPHVGHMRKHRKEYIGELNSFLEGLNLPGVHDNEGDKITSKL